MARYVICFVFKVCFFSSSYLSMIGLHLSTLYSEYKAKVTGC